MLVKFPAKNRLQPFPADSLVLPSNNHTKLSTTVNATKSARLIAEIPTTSTGQRGNFLLPFLRNLATNHFNASENLPPRNQHEHQRQYPARSKRRIEYSTTLLYVSCD